MLVPVESFSVKGVKGFIAVPLFTLGSEDPLPKPLEVAFPNGDVVLEVVPKALPNAGLLAPKTLPPLLFVLPNPDPDKLLEPPKAELPVALFEEPKGEDVLFDEPNNPVPVFALLDPNADVVPDPNAFPGLLDPNTLPVWLDPKTLPPLPPPLVPKGRVVLFVFDEAKGEVLLPPDDPNPPNPDVDRPNIVLQYRYVKFY